MHLVVATYRVMRDKTHTDILILLVDHLVLTTIINNEFLPSWTSCGLPYKLRHARYAQDG